MHEINDSPRYKPNQRIHLSSYLSKGQIKNGSFILSWIFFPSDFVSLDLERERLQMRQGLRIWLAGSLDFVLVPDLYE